MTKTDASLDRPDEKSARGNGASPKSGDEAKTVHSGPKTLVGSIFPGPSGELDEDLYSAVKELERAFSAPAWLIVQQHEPPKRVNPMATPFIIGEFVRDGFFTERASLKAAEKPLLIIDSPGGDADSAYEIAQLFRRHAGGFRAVVPRYAKSAATLLLLGADEIYMGEDAEIGPLDAQIFDFEREERTSALNEVQALERLHIEAMDQIDKTVQHLMMRTNKKSASLLPSAIDIVLRLMCPLVDKLDTVHYTEQARILKVAEDYASRLLRPRFSEEEAVDIAYRLVTRYSSHSFVINREEAEFIGLSEPTTDQAEGIRRLEELFSEEEYTVLGQIREVSDG